MGNRSNSGATAQQRIAGILQELGIDEDYPESCGLPLHQDCTDLVNTEEDVFGRQPQLDVAAFNAWRAMREAASADDIVLQIVSAYRSIEYQRGLFLRKLAAGKTIDEILCVNAAPGFSEHHSGCAIDIGTPDFQHLEVEFENSPAFEWLSKNAEKFGFFLSFPQSGKNGIQYEPWHWCYRKESQRS